VLAAYVAMTPPVPGDGDCGELTLVLARGALAHPTGYPLYTMLGHGFAVAAHALGASWALAAALWSAVGASLAAYFLFRLADALIGPAPGLGRPARLALVSAAILFFALNPMVSFEATHAEVYSWHLAWVSGVALLFARIAGTAFETRPEGPAGGSAGAWIAWGLACGAGLAHHSSALVVAAPLTLALVVLWLVKAPRRLRAAPLAIPAALVPLASYAFVFWKVRHPDPADWLHFERSAAGALAHVNAQLYESRVVGTFAPTPEQAAFLARWIHPWLAAGLVLGAIVALMQPRRSAGRFAAAALAGAGAVAGGLVFKLRVYDPSPYFLAPLALGASFLAVFPASLAGRAPPRARGLIAAAVLAAALATSVSWFLVGQTRKETMVDLDSHVRAMWRAIPPGPGVVFWNDDMFQRLRAIQLLEGERTDLDVQFVDAFGSAVARSRFRERHGFDPLDGLPPDLLSRVRLDEYYRAVMWNVNRLSAGPVYEFDAQRRAVRAIRKPAPESR
jgi:hypothetical protein